MKQVVLGLLTAASLIIYSCGNGNNATTAKEENTADSTQHAATAEAAEVKVVKATFTDVDAGVASQIKKITEQYLKVKDALTATNANDAGTAAQGVGEALKGFDKSLLTADQKKVYDANEGGIKQFAEQIAKSTSDIEKQRDQFANLSQSMYTLVKAFGGGKTLYHEYCPMAKNDKGAMWLSDNKAIRNPYFGDKMIECGTVEEEIQ